MIEEDISYNKKYEHSASVCLTNTEFQGTLKFSGNTVPSFTTNSFLDCSNPHFLGADKNVKVVCSESGQVYTLLKVDVFENSLFPEYLIKGESNDDVTGIEILLTGLSTWFNQKQNRSFELSDGKIIKHLHDYKIAESIYIEGKKYLIESELRVQTKRLEKQNYQITEYTTILVKSLDGVIPYDSVKNISNDIRTLFSLLVGYELIFENIWIRNTNKQKLPFYFIHRGEKNDPFERDIECILMPEHLSKRNLWNDVLKSYFSKKVFKLIWSGLPSLFSFQGDLGFEILGYVSLLDAHCSEFAEKNRNKLNKIAFKKIQSDLLEVINEHRSDLDLKYDSVFESIKTSIGGIKNTNLPTFKDKFYALKQTVEPEILDIIGLSESHFDHIKNLRNQVAHGSLISFKEKGSIRYELAIRDKIRLLLTYFMYRDLGIDPVTFALALQRTTNQTVRNAFINRFALDKLIGNTPLYEVNIKDFQYVSNNSQSNLVLYYFKSHDSYNIDYDLTDKVVNYWQVEGYKKYSNVKDFIISSLGEYVSIEHISRSYLTCNGKHKVQRSLCLITVE